LFFPTPNHNYTVVCKQGSSVLFSFHSFSQRFSSCFLIADYFSTIESHVLSTAGSGLAAIFACGLYTFLGPVTADRSLASQLLVLLQALLNAVLISFTGLPESPRNTDSLFAPFLNFISKINFRNYKICFYLRIKARQPFTSVDK
jgi:hypothetical protein